MKSELASRTQVTESPELWEVNQGKRLIKRLRKCGVQPGAEMAFLVQAMKTVEATLAVDKAKGEGKTAEESTAVALAAVSRVKEVEPTGNVGRDLYRFLVDNGATPGRVKAGLDKVLFVAGVTDGCPSELIE